MSHRTVCLKLKIIANEATELRSEVASAAARNITPRNVGKNSQILRNPLKFAFLTIFGCKKTPYLGSDVMVLYLQLVVRNWVIQCAAVRCRFKRT